MQKNKYDLAQEVASFLCESETFETCERCFMKKECWEKAFDEKKCYPEKTLCDNHEVLRSAIEKKYNL